MPLFIITTPIRDLAEFRTLAQHAARLKKFGAVQVNIGTLALKSRHEIPVGGSPWHEYAACGPAPEKFFPDEMIAPFLPEGFVGANRKLLLEKAKILREHKLGAAFWSYLPNFLPEAFFEKYPSLRGPRTDHPRRSLKEAFAPCVDRPEVREMYRRMIKTLLQNVPEIGTFYFKTNDAGPGLCWSDWQYVGPNGPAACRHTPMGQRVKLLLESVQQGAADAGKSLTIHMTGNFSRAEVANIQAQLPPNCFVRGGHKMPMAVSSLADQCYPVRGVFDPIAILQTLHGLKDGQSSTIFVDFRTFYDRGHEDLATSSRMIEVIEAHMADPAYGHLPMFQKLRGLCDRWAGETVAAVADRAPADTSAGTLRGLPASPRPATAALPRGEQLFDAFLALHEALKFKRQALPRLSPIYMGVSMRYINRPLVIRPQDLTAEEESYWLPHVFNVSRQEARLDWLDLHGGRVSPVPMLGEEDTRLWTIDTLRAQIESVARQFESIGGTIGDELARAAMALRIYNCILRSMGNFYTGQILRDRNAAAIAGPPRTPSKTGNWTGDADLVLFNEVTRDELDNTQELIDLLENGGLAQLTHAEKEDDEDTFLLGPGIVDQLKKKRQIMLAHWRDIEAYLTTPLK